MGLSSRLSSLFLLFAALPALRALEVTPGSSCASLCLNDGETDAYDPDSSSTNTTDISCSDADYSEEGTGIKFKSCIECLAKSTRVEDEESDLHWYLCKSSTNPNTRLSYVRRKKSEANCLSQTIYGIH